MDESDKLFEAGVRGFRDQLAEIYKACDSAHVRRAMFSATYTVQVAKWCKKNLANLTCITIGHRLVMHLLRLWLLYTKINCA